MSVCLGNSVLNYNYNINISKKAWFGFLGFYFFSVATFFLSAFGFFLELNKGLALRRLFFISLKKKQQKTLKNKRNKISKQKLSACHNNESVTSSFCQSKQSLDLLSSVDFGDLIKTTPLTQNSGPPPQSLQYLNMGPGLYAIRCSASNKIYFGESSNVVHRIGTHFDDLVQGKHECKEMQEDWVKHGESSFTFVSLTLGQEWIDATVRREAETKLLLLNKNIIYNQSIAGSTPKRIVNNYHKVVSYKGTVYNSIAEASRQTQVSETHIRRLLRTPSNTDWQYVVNPESESVLDDSLIINVHMAKKVKIGDQVYRSIRQAAFASGMSRRTLQRRLDSSKPEDAHITYV